MAMRLEASSVKSELILLDFAQKKEKVECELKKPYSRRYSARRYLKG